MEKSLRAACRGQLTRLVNIAEEILDTEPNNVNELQVVKARIKEAHGKLSAANEKMMEKLTDSDEQVLSVEWAAVLEYDDTAVKILTELEIAIKNATACAPDKEVMEGQKAPQNVVQDNKKASVILPKLQLIKFNGDPHQWTLFWEQYVAVIHENRDLDDNAKFSYLKTLLTEKAASAIQSLTPSQACYQDAIELLKNEFGNPEKLIDTYIQKLLVLQPVKHKGDVFSLRKLYNTTTTITRSLQTLGVSSNQYGMMLKSVILKAIPYSMRIDFNKYVIREKLGFEAQSVVSDQFKTSEISYEDQISKLLSFLKVEIESVEQAQNINTDNDKQKRPYENKFVRKATNDDICTTAGLFTSVQENCLFCQSKNHETINCNSNLSLNQKKDILKSKGRCFRCTKGNHSSRFCHSRNLRCAKCSKRHATSLCDPNYLNIHRQGKQGQEFAAATNSNDNNIVKTDGHISTSTSLFTNDKIGNVYLQTATAYIVNNDTNQVLIRLILDGGSQTSFVKENVSRKLNLRVVNTHNISIMPFGKSDVTPGRQCQRVSLKLKGQSNDEVLELTAVEVPEICFDSLRSPSVQDPIVHKFAMEYQLADTNTERRDFDGISLLIGADQYWSVVTNENKRLTETLTAVNTKLGWTLLGANKPTGFSASLNVVSNVLHVQECPEEMDLRKFWDLESIGILSDNEVSKNITSNFINDQIKFNGDRYEVCLPWLNDNVTLDSNYSSALSRLKSLTNRLIKNSRLIEYDSAVREYLLNDCAEYGPDEITSPVYYMPHRPVYKEDRESTKIRVVFDASSHTQGMSSLNELLDPGENLVPELLRVLINFRIGKIGLTADIEKAFLQISLNERERDCHRFLWYAEPITNHANLPNLVEFRMKRVTFGVTCSPFLLAATLRKHLSSQPQEDSQVCNIMRRSFYVDDLLVSCDTVEDAQRIYTHSRQIMARANMNLRKWYSNDVTLTKFFNPVDHVVQTKKILGIFWCLLTDEISTNLEPVLSDLAEQPITKRYVLSSVSKVYDPLGVLGPFTVRGKILIQKIWKNNLEWDIPLSQDLYSDWLKWKSELSLLSDFTFPRCIVKSKCMEVELHLFADASPHAFGAVAYLRSCSIKKEVECHYLMSKNRIAPIDDKGNSSLTLPKMELTAALCAAKLQIYIIKNLDLKIKKIYLWTDSKITLYWIRGKSSRWKPYVANRVNDIQNLSKGEWRHCPGSNNPADLLTRGVKAKVLLESDLWRFGPEWLVEEESQWPKEDNKDCDELVSSFLNITEPKIANREPIFPIENFSKLERIIRVTAFIHRFVSNINKPLQKLVGRLSIKELKEARNYWIRHIQNSEYEKEIKALGNNEKVSTSNIMSLNPFLDNDGILRIGGRLHEAVLPYETRHPIILPRKSHFGNLLIWSCHKSVAHGGVNITLAEVRKRFWLIQGRQTIKRLVGSCITCQKMKGKSGNEKFAPLPKDRVTMANPFKVSGIDFAGPLYVITNDHQKNRVYIMLLTCAVVRAVHLELVPDLTTESCIRGLRRFIARRGVPNIIYSDNAKTFKRASLELRKLFECLSRDQLQNFASQLHIDWRFIVERAAWWGGFWERMVKTVKSALKVVLGKSSVKYDELQTVLTEVESTVNSRPLTYIDNDPNSFILTPAHFLFGSSDSSLNVNVDRVAAKGNDILKLWRTRENIMNKFWKTWKVDYLQQLRSAHHNGGKVQSRSFKIGDIALLHDQNVPRQLWKLVKIVQTYTGRDGRIRACEIRTGNGSILKRPVQLLYPLEIEPAGEDVKN